ncbi:DNA recombination protein RmuC [Pelobacter seleniigenes]|uniref:DNA recombination protein RmuC n=1 Tax=Pelobacter seleniigenes TaxID=407188 RepID=UPI00068C29CD
MGEGITASIGQLGNVQKEKLEIVAQEIAKLIEKQKQDQSELRKTIETKLVEIRTDSSLSSKGLREELTNTFRQLGETLTSNIATSSQSQKERLEQVAKEIAGLTLKQEQAQENLRKTVEQRLDNLRGENAEKLESIRKTVDEQLQGTLEKRLGESFKLVSERLEQVHKGLGEMQTLANGVGDLKRVLTNVKARGTWGEVQLGTLLEQMLTPEQYLREAATKPGSQERVEFAVRLPGKGEGDPEVLLPIDAKFPIEDYERLISAAERSDADAVEAAAKQLDNRIKGCAKDIRDKYINPPYTTDFAILFLPTEGLYAEVLRRPGTVEQIQRDFRVTIAGPTTLAATLNALQMGFRTLAIQKRSSEVWQVLEAVKTEFGKYGVVLEKVQKKLHEASKTIDDVTVRRRAIDRKLRAIGSMPEEKAEALLGLGPADLEDLSEADSVGAET